MGTGFRRSARAAAHADLMGCPLVEGLNDLAAKHANASEPRCEMALGGRRFYPEG